MISVVIPTRDRHDNLNLTLESLTTQKVLFAWEVIVVVNGDNPERYHFLKAFEKRIPLTVVYVPEANKSHALNTGIKRAQGDIVAFTDDDVEASDVWLSELSRAADAHPQGAVFCGPIIPRFPKDPGWIGYHWSGSLLFASFRPLFREGILPPPLVPFGPNFAVRRTTLNGVEFRVDLGPRESDALMSEDTTFLKQLRSRSAVIMYVPSAVVFHRIRAELTDLPSLLERFFRYGRSVIVQGQAPVLSLPNLIYGSASDTIHRFDLGGMLSFLYGELFQLKACNRDVSQHLRLAIDSLDWSGDPAVIARSAATWLADNMEYVPEHARTRFSAVLPARAPSQPQFVSATG